MNYYKDENVLIRDMEPEDIESIVRGEREQVRDILRLLISVFWKSIAEKVSEIN